MPESDQLQQRVETAARSIASLAPIVADLAPYESAVACVGRAAKRGHFTPSEDEEVRLWWARYLTAREALLRTIIELRPFAEPRLPRVDDELKLRAFVLCYTAACLLVRAARFLVTQIAIDSATQRKLNEADPIHRIARNQYTAVRRSLTSLRNAWSLTGAIEFADSNRNEINDLATDTQMKVIIDALTMAEPSLRVDWRRFWRARLAYRWHSIRQRHTSAVQEVLYNLLEASGRLLAELRIPWHEPSVDAVTRDSIVATLLPGDVLITRHHDAASNLFLPGYWPHAALHIGSELQRRELGVDVDSDRATRCRDPFRILEARKDGVLFREPSDTFAVDALTVLRPCISPEELRLGLQRIIPHEGKLYNFDFDFFSSDRLVCTEVVYRAFDGLGPINFELTRRAGRLCLAAEEIVDVSLKGDALKPVLAFGLPGTTGILRDEEAAAALRKLKRCEPG